MATKLAPPQPRSGAPHGSEPSDTGGERHCLVADHTGGESPARTSTWHPCRRPPLASATGAVEGTAVPPDEHAASLDFVAPTLSPRRTVRIKCLAMLRAGTRRLGRRLRRVGARRGLERCERRLRVPAS